MSTNSFIINQLINGNCIIKVGKGKANYKMNRGSFKTHDFIYEMHKLKSNNINNNEVLYSYKDIVLKINIIEKKNDIFEILFDLNKDFNRFELTIETFDDECIYGCGEQYTTLNLKGKTVPIWVSEHQQTLQIARKLLHLRLFGPNPDKISSYKKHQTYVSSPIFMSSKNYAFYCHEDSYGEIKFKKTGITFDFREIPKSITFILANSQKELAEKLAMNIGISPKIPDWVNDGIILAIQGGIDVVKQKYKEAKEKGMKIAGIWSQDWCGNVVTSFGYQVFWNWKLDDNLYKGLPEFIEELKKDGVRFLGYINTFLKENAPLYLEAKEKGYLVKKHDGTVYHIKSTTFDAGIVDLTNPDAFTWYKNIIKENMIGIGLSGFMADFGEYLPTDSVVYGGDATKLHNDWPTLWAKCCHEAIFENKSQDEVFMFSRAAFSDTVKYTNSIWNGDQHVDYSDEYGLGSVIPASLSLSCSGCGVTHSDIGGYTTVMWMKRDYELLLRWSEMNIFTPIYRTHEGNRPMDNVQFDDPRVIDEMVQNSNIFYDLKPYRLFVENEYQTNGTPMIRPLFFHFDDKQSKIEKREFLFGEDILVSPVIREKENKHNVFLPDENWIQFFTEKEYNGGLSVVDSPLGLPIAFYRANSKHKDLFKQISNKYKIGE